MNTSSIAFAIVVAACLFAPGDHYVLFGTSVFGLWMTSIKFKIERKDRAK